MVNLIEKQFLSLKWVEKNILLALCAFKNIVFVEKKFCCAEKKKFTPKKTIAPRFKLNGCSLSSESPPHYILFRMSSCNDIRTNLL